MLNPDEGTPCPPASPVGPLPVNPSTPLNSPVGPQPVETAVTTSDEPMERGSSILSESVEGAEALSFARMSLEEPSNVPEAMDVASTSAPLQPSSAPHSPSRDSRRDSDTPAAQRREIVWEPLPQPRVSRPFPQVPPDTPENFSHPLINYHPWAALVKPRLLPLSSLTEHDITIEMPTEDYHHIPPSGYQSYKFTKWLFPFIKPERVGREERIPLIELQTLEAAIRFRRECSAIKEQLLNGAYNRVENTRPQTPRGQNPTLATPPPVINGRRPVLYQVVATNRGAGLILESKDFFVPGPDQKELQCVTLDQYATNIQSNLRGFDKFMVSVKDFVWIWTVEPTLQAIRDPQMILERARSPRTYTLDNDAVFFFRAATFAFAAPQARKFILGNVIHIYRKDNQTPPHKFSAGFAGAPESVIITAGLTDFNIADIREDEMVVGQARYNVSTAIRFSEPPVSVAARKKLCALIRRTVPCHPREGILPLSVSKLEAEEQEWIDDRDHEFTSIISNPPLAKLRMAHLFNMACSTLAAIKSDSDDRLTHWIEAEMISTRIYPLQVVFTIPGMSSERGWERGRPVEFWIDGAPHTIILAVHHVGINPETRELRATLAAYPWSNDSLAEATQRYGTYFDDIYHLVATVRLGKAPVASEPAYEAISRMEIFDNVRPGTMADRMVNRIYNVVNLECSPTASARVPELSEADQLVSRTDANPFRLSEDQCKAVELGCSDYSIVAIQAAYGTGKTVVGAVIASLLAVRQNQRVVVTASTNNAVAQFAKTLLEIRNERPLNIVRYVSDTAAADDQTPLAVDLNEVLKTLGDDFASSLSEHQRSICRRFKEGRLRFEYYKGQLNQELTEQQRDEYILAEKDVSNTIEKMVKIMFQVRPPHVICITTASLLNTSGPKGLFAKYLGSFSTLISDEASQIPEPVLIAMANRLPQVRHICIGDVHQLEPHIRCSRNSNPARFGAKSVMDVLMRSRTVPVASLVTTFRSHPLLNDLPNVFVYQGQLRSGVTAEQRALLTQMMRFPDGRTPFLFLDVAGNSERAASRSYYNDAEAEVCRTIVQRLLARGIEPSSLCILSFYKEQLRRLMPFAQRNQVELATVDSIQGREKDVIILLTTRTDMHPASAEFLDEYKRLNVSLTRSRHGMFVLGHTESLWQIPSWSTILRWADERQAIIPATDLGQYLPVE